MKIIFTQFQYCTYCFLDTPLAQLLDFTTSHDVPQKQSSPLTVCKKILKLGLVLYGRATKLEAERPAQMLAKRSSSSSQTSSSQPSMPVSTKRHCKPGFHLDSNCIHATRSVGPTTLKPFHTASKLFGRGSFPDFRQKPLGATEQELHVLGRQPFHSDFIIVDGAIDHVGFLLL